MEDKLFSPKEINEYYKFLVVKYFETKKYLKGFHTCDYTIRLR